MASLKEIVSSYIWKYFRDVFQLFLEAYITQAIMLHKITTGIEDY